LKRKGGRQSDEKDEIWQDVIVANPKHLNNRVKLHFLVDTGSSGCAIPVEVAKKLKLECVGEGEIILANGTRIHAKIAYLYMKIDDEHVFTLVSYDGCEKALLGFDVMHLLGLQIDTGKKEVLKPMRRFSLRNLIFSKGWISSRRGRR